MTKTDIESLIWEIKYIIISNQIKSNQIKSNHINHINCRIPVVFTIEKHVTDFPSCIILID
jgi:hypothetical protein